MSFLLTTLLPMLAPAFADGIRGVFSKLTGGAGGSPQNVGERIELMRADNERLMALAQVDTPSGTPSQWVVDFRSSFRYITILLIWILTAMAIFDTSIKENILIILLDLSGASMSFIIGERMYFNLKGR